MASLKPVNYLTLCLFFIIGSIFNLISFGQCFGWSNYGTFFAFSLVGLYVCGCVVTGESVSRQTERQRSAACRCASTFRWGLVGSAWARPVGHTVHSEPENCLEKK